MPLVRISMTRGRSAGVRQAISDAIHQAMIETINIPADDKFQLLTEHAPGEMVFDRGYLGVNRTDDLIVVQITLNAGRSVEMKKALFSRIAALLSAKAGVRPQDVLVNLVEVPRENWSFGDGLAQYAP